MVVRSATPSRTGDWLGRLQKFYFSRVKQKNQLGNKRILQHDSKPQITVPIDLELHFHEKD